MKKLILAALLVSTAAMAEDRRMLIINKSDEAIIGLYGSDVGKNKWQYNMLAGDAIPVGESRLADFDEGAGWCRFDLLATGAAGGRWEHYNMNVCVGESWTLR
jgi:hypothetical protein